MQPQLASMYDKVLGFVLLSLQWYGSIAAICELTLHKALTIKIEASNGAPDLPDSHKSKY